MAHKNWCKNPCTDCKKPCSLDKAIPCSPDCENLVEDNHILIKRCLSDGCEEIKLRDRTLGGAGMYSFEEEYRMIFETPLEELKEDIFFRADNFEREAWYGDLQMYQAIGVCNPKRDHALDLQKALKVLGYSTNIKKNDKGLFLVPLRKKQQVPP